MNNFITKHSKKHAFKPNIKLTKKSTQFNEHIDVAKLREDILLYPDKINYRKDQNVIVYEVDTPTGSQRVFINLDSKPNKMSRNSQFSYFRGINNVKFIYNRKKI